MHKISQSQCYSVTRIYYKKNSHRNTKNLSKQHKTHSKELLAYILHKLLDYKATEGFFIETVTVIVEA